ncbi:cobaltochelatase subunit CobN [Pseudomonas daroniae]|uniref:Cobaltochelatase subunit CobN n=1 Tax=Phytopseudomonas daroniae TaxID=2487519 RepID=A0A4Q9QKY0_9GAMM|nr:MULTISPECIES: cobaltochelatase subunit CobN [Pseudomonas]TBU77868.1 cobaltochelatase subunit CobN [Pseudomonas daroniae]TBU82215.1 cobaltochelatase subunit CobN [Pseudomonas sp. FRB 228]TBU91157.1 cobaltochelatase subunit CobN [Pseudomonas daroniae]
MRQYFYALLALLIAGSAVAEARESKADVRILTTDFVLQGKLDRLQQWGQEAGLSLQSEHLSKRLPGLGGSLLGARLVLLDTPRPSDLAEMQQALGDELTATSTPWLRVGGGSPAFGNLPAPVAMRLAAYYGNGGERNLRHFFLYLKAYQTGTASDDIPKPELLGKSGIYHPQAPEVFERLEDYLQWGAARWPEKAPRVAFAIHRGAIVDAQLRLIDDLLLRSERHGQAPLVFWFDDSDPQALQKLLKPWHADVLVNLQHMQNAPARKAEFLALGIPVIATLVSREGDREHWRQAGSGISPRTAATLLSVPESWGMSDPLVIGAVEGGEPLALDEQVEILLGKVDSLARLRHTSPADKHLALMFWNHPDGERNIAASNLNVPRSLQHLLHELAVAGYDVHEQSEQQLIDAARQLLGGYYHPQTLDRLLEKRLAITLPLSAYQAWLAQQPRAVQQQLRARWGEPSVHWALREVDGEQQFVIPAMRLGKLILMPQPPRAGRPGEAYHDAKVPPDHVYLAAYQYLREGFKANALIHFGTHGTQEWLPGKDRGLAASDYPFLALGDLPVFYPYIQDNIGEAMQARRRGRAVIVSHQTPPFAPAGLYDELRDLHELLHEYQQLDEGAVREETAERIRVLALDNDLGRDIGWDETRMRADFGAFLAALHEHVHDLAEANTPLGLHTFGLPATLEQRLATVLQQLGEPYLQALGVSTDEPLAEDFAALKASLPYRTLERYLSQPAAIAQIDNARLREQIERARDLERHLANPGEMQALLAGLAGGFIAPGPGGDPIRNPQVPSGRNLYAFEADKLPTRSAYASGEVALEQLLDSYRREHGGQYPSKLAFSLWSSEAMRHLGVLESQVLHALGLRPIWDAGGRVTGLEIIPARELGRPRIDAVVQVTSVYRDQFDGFMRLLADTFEQLAQLDEPGNSVFANSQSVAMRLRAEGVEPERALQLSRVRVFGNEAGDYGTGVSRLALDSTKWEGDSAIAEQFLARLQYGYSASGWGQKLEGHNLFAEHLKGVQAAVMARSSELNGVLSTDHPFEFLGGLSAAVRHLDGASPALYISDLRKTRPRTSGAAEFLASELRSRYLNPQWISAMKEEGYAGTLELLDVTNNLFGWQAADPSTVRADQWQALHDTYVMDKRDLQLDRWFEQHNPTAQAQLIERMAEAIRKGYWDAPEQTRRELAQRWTELTEQHEADAGAPLTTEFVQQMGSGFGLANPAASNAAQGAGETVQGQVLREVQPAEPPPFPWALWLGACALLACIFWGAARQWFAGRQQLLSKRFVQDAT